MLNFKEMDVVDFVALSFLRVFHHPIYDHIPSWKNALQSGKEQTGLVQEVDIDDAAWMAAIRPLVGSENDVLLVKNILGGLFSGIRSNVLYPKEHKLALSDNAYFSGTFYSASRMMMWRISSSTLRYSTSCSEMMTISM
jgi:hypothetical protein